MVQAKLPSAKLPRSAMLLGWVFEIDNHQAPSWFEHAGHFSESLPFEVIRQMVHHQGTQHDIKRLVGEGELLDHPDLEVDGRWARLALERARAICLGPGSMPHTRPVAPTRLQATIASAPVPHPTSSTASPG